MRFIDLGLMDYKEALGRQREMMAERAQERGEDTLILCSHPPVVTLGKQGDLSDIAAWRGPFYWVERGGRATYHGPEQIVVYPIIDLKQKGRNIAKFLDALERGVVKALSTYALMATGNPFRGRPALTGVRIGGRKIASIGVAVKRWVTYHGLAINFSASDGLKTICPCGEKGREVTSVEELKGVGTVPRMALERHLLKCLSGEIESINRLSFDHPRQ